MGKARGLKLGMVEIFCRNRKEKEMVGNCVKKKSKEFDSGTQTGSPRGLRKSFYSKYRN